VAEPSAGTEIRELQHQLEQVASACGELVARREGLDREAEHIAHSCEAIRDRLSGPVVDSATRDAVESAVRQEVLRRAEALCPVRAEMAARREEIDGAIESIDIQLENEAELVDRAALLPTGTEVVLHLSESINDLNEQRQFAVSLLELLDAPVSGGVAPGAAVSETRRGEWVDRGVTAVEVAAIPPQSEIQPGDFRKVSEATMRQGLLRLQEMRPAIESGAGANVDYWRQKDASLKLAYEDGYQRVYEAFYGHDAIRVEQEGATFTVVNGRHRLHLAQEMGIGSLPMRVVERRPTGE
jgi:hypothetical protein